MSDSDPIMSQPPTAMGSNLMEILSHVQWKLLISLIVMIGLMRTDVFYNILSSFNGAMDLTHPSSYGELISLMFIAIAFIILDMLIANRIV